MNPDTQRSEAPPLVPDAAIDLVVAFEQSGVCAIAPYRDPAGIPTLGYGSIWDRRFTPMQRVTMATASVDAAMAREWMRAELGDASAAVNRLVKVKLHDDERAALLDFIYNVGVGAFAVSRLLRKLNVGDYIGAEAQFASWNLAAGKVMQGLVRRRTAEAALFAQGRAKREAAA